MASSAGDNRRNRTLLWSCKLSLYTNSRSVYSGCRLIALSWTVYKPQHDCQIPVQELYQRKVLTWPSPWSYDSLTVHWSPAFSQRRTRRGELVQIFSRGAVFSVILRYTNADCFLMRLSLWIDGWRVLIYRRTVQPSIIPLHDRWVASEETGTWGKSQVWNYLFC